MKIDTNAGVFTFSNGEHIQPEEISAMLAVMPLFGGDWTVEFEEMPETVVPPVEVVQSWFFRSDTTDRIYTVVRLSSDVMACSCPDFQHRRIHTGESCKHMIRAVCGWR